MKDDHATKTAAEKIKAHAKELTNSSDLTYQQALEAASKHAGYESWNHVRSCIKPTSKDIFDSGFYRAVEEVRPNDAEQAKTYFSYLDRLSTGIHIKQHPAYLRAFHRVEIEGHYFCATAIGDSGPHIFRATLPKGGDTLGEVALGVSQMYYTRKRSYSPRSNPYEWWICKYDQGQPQVPLGDLSAPARFAVAYHFGLAIEYDDRENAPAPWRSNLCGLAARRSLFYWTPAFRSLCEIAIQHPRKVRNWGSGYSGKYVGNWTECAIEVAKIMRSAKRGGGAYNQDE